MRRYAETFFRYWIVVLIPLVVLPAATYFSVRHTPNSYLVSANIQVDQDPPGYTNQYISVAQNEADAIDEFLQSPSSIYGVLTTGNLLQRGRGVRDVSALVTDIARNTQVTPRGDHLVNVAYTNQNFGLGVQVVQALLAQVQSQQQQATSAQNQSSLYILNYQLAQAQKQATQSYKTLHDYMDQHGDTASDLTGPQITDPQLASLYQQSQLDIASVNDYRQQISKARAQTVLPPGTAQPGVFTVKDPPSGTIVSATKKKLTPIAIALAVALVLSGAFLVVKTALDHTLRYPDEVPAVLDLPLLAVVPYAGAQGSRRGRSPQPAAAGVPRLVDA